MTELPLQDGYMPETTLQERREMLLETVREALAAEDLDALRRVLNNQHPADLAELFRYLDDEEQQTGLQVITGPLAAEMLADMDTSTMLDVAEDLDDAALSDLVEEMDPDDAADVLGDLPQEQSEKVLDLMEVEEAAEVRELMTHPEDTAGGIMTTRLVAVRENATVAEAAARLREWVEEDDIVYLYAVDAAERLVGTVPLKRLLLSPPEASIDALTRRDPIKVRVDTDQEEIARLFVEYDLLALPVVDEQDRLLGRVTVDDVVDVIQEEATEDMYEMAAIIKDDQKARSVFGIVQQRLPWLLVCLAGTLLSGAVIHAFAAPLEQIWPLLVIFVPAIMAMGGNAGIQTSTVTVRSLATGQLQMGEGWTSVFRELRVAVGLGKFLGILVLAVAYIWTDNLLVGGCTGLAMLAAVVLSAGLGAIIPLLFRSLGIDPAIASGPLITTVNDALSLIIYFTIAAYLLRLWGP